MEKNVQSTAKEKRKTGKPVHKGGYHKRSLDVRIHELDVAIADTLKLRARRELFVKRDKEKLEMHQGVLQLSNEKLEQLAAKRARLVQERDHPLTKEEKMALRAQRKAEEEKVSRLLKMLNDNGKTLDDLLDAMNEKD